MLTEQWWERIEKIEQELTPYPILEYSFLKTEQVTFSRKVRKICRQECPRYNTSWSCPPAVGTVEECEERCRRLPACFVFTTAGEAADSADAEKTNESRAEHEKITDRVTEIFRKRCGDVLVLSSCSCGICQDMASAGSGLYREKSLSGCTWPSSPCRFPERMRPCVESYGILVPELAEKAGIAYDAGPGSMIWFGVVFFS